MNHKYKFEAEKFALSDDSIHLLRNRFNYKTIPLNKVDKIELVKGKDLSNWLWVLIIGLLLLGYSLYDVSNIFSIFSDAGTRTIYIERLLIPLLPFLLGVYTVITAIRNSIVMKVFSSSKSYYFSLRRIISQGNYNDFEDALKKSFDRVDNRT